MTALPRRVLVVEDEPLMQANLQEILAEASFVPVPARSLAEARAALADAVPPVVLLDLRLPDGSGLDLLRDGLDAAVIVLTAFGDSRNSIEAMRLGALDYVTKPFDVDDLLGVVGRAYEHRAETERARRTAAEATAEPDAPGLVGQSPGMREVYKRIGRAARADVPVLVSGESGTGKELVARALHAASARAGGPFVAVNCAAIPRDLIESELFGYEKGAFTGAVAQRAGVFEQARGGTLFLDEIGDLGLDVQAKLLRVLQEGVFARVGGREPLRADVRVVSATHRDLAAMAAEGAFRQDLYFRLHVFRIHLPPLRERGPADVQALAEALLRRHAPPGHPGLAPEARAALAARPWPGNVRELENAIRHALLMAGDEVVLARHLPPPAALAEPAGADGVALGEGFSMQAHLEAVEKALVARAMREAAGVRTRAAELLGIHRRLLYEKLRRYGLGGD
ncbi:MAG: sigma-54-dependent transcriptional regulator [Rubricoccaceae bacterium]